MFVERYGRACHVHPCLVAALWLSFDYYLFRARLHTAFKKPGEGYIYLMTLPASKKTVAPKTASVETVVDGQRELRLRVYSGSAIAMGPGKADLLEAIVATGSIAGAGRSLGMSYRRCWELVSIMNAQFLEPLVLSAKGGSNGGGAELSPLGNEVLKRYRAMELRATKAIAPDVARMRKLLKQ